MTDAPQNPESSTLTLTVLPERLAICRLAPDAPVPDWFRRGPLASITYTEDELSIITTDDAVPEGVTAERGWRALKVIGPLDFSLTGVLASIVEPLAQAGISIFALSTYDTDYILVREESLDAAAAALEEDFDVSAPEPEVDGSPRAPTKGTA